MLLLTVIKIIIMFILCYSSLFLAINNDLYKICGYWFSYAPYYTLCLHQQGMVGVIYIAGKSGMGSSAAHESQVPQACLKV